MKEISIFKINDKLIKIIIEDNKISLIDFLDLNPQELIEPKYELAKDIKNQLTLYFNGKLKEFNLPLNIQGTDFERKVYEALLNISYGQTLTYKELAEKINHPKAYRAVGTAAGKNKIPIIIPCHRLIGQNNNLRGFRYGIDMKRELLKLENII
ncbi:methylated-DNA--[protein]-cysteine S-methyltransferase [Peptoniphilus sp. MSJ-1]|uniref:Methylated-DNA--[protein]-cysteine S-methyltransferase n=1 Tax=Peptoniphilus ovalis TaxID=2841503 RepID=A0ABS6FGI7_9FIRM|nr:methylated-DNA--[protein]-cysteine S-methyltransferase [Peptoniphilus ovalis]MBU5669138.1 methylated-DNA--[protein]-cysteine S-methyltransferase [Peptoniphilus ovalis]